MEIALTDKKNFESLKKMDENNFYFYVSSLFLMIIF